MSNNGKVYVCLNLSGTKTAAQFIGGTSPVYRWNVTVLEVNSCLNATGGTGNLPYGFFANVNTSQQQFCNNFSFVNSADAIVIQFNLTVPADSSTGALSDTITATVW